MKSLFHCSIEAFRIDFSAFALRLVCYSAKVFRLISPEMVETVFLLFQQCRTIVCGSNLQGEKCWNRAGGARRTRAGSASQNPMAAARRQRQQAQQQPQQAPQPRQQVRCWLACWKSVEWSSSRFVTQLLNGMVSGSSAAC